MGTTPFGEVTMMQQQNKMVQQGLMIKGHNDYCCGMMGTFAGDSCPGVNEPAVDTSLHVRFKRTEQFNGEGKYEGDTLLAKIQWHHWNMNRKNLDWQEANPDWPRGEDPRPFKRLEMAFIERLVREREYFEDDPGVDVRLDEKARSITIVQSYGDLSLEGLLNQVQMVATDWRMGNLFVPTITEKMHQEMVELNCKLRKSDGLFSYRRLCARKECDTECNTCFGATSLNKVRTGRERRSLYHCSTICWLKDGNHLGDLCDDWLYLLAGNNEEHDGDDKSTVYREVREAIGGLKWVDPEEKDELTEECYDALIALHETNPELFKKYLDAITDGMDYEYYGETGEVACEV